MKKNFENNSYIKTYSILIYLYFLMKPIYLFNSGLPQISDIIMVTIIGYTLIINKIKKSSLCIDFIMISFIFIIYIFIVNGLFTIIYSDFSIFKTSLWYAYNLIVCITFIEICKLLDDKFWYIIFKSNSISLVVQVIALIVNYDPSLYRQIGMFNNPNQLGYYAVVSISLVTISFMKINSKKDKWYKKVYISFVCAFTLTVGSASKAAIASILLLIIIFTILNWKYVKQYTLLFTILMLFIFIGISKNENIEFKSMPMIGNLIYRIENKQSDDSIEGRYYDRIWKYPEYIIFGSGEGHYSRFGVDAEMHSTFGNILMSYGIIGILIFIVIIIYSICQSGILIGGCMLLPTMLYGLTHNGIRNTLIWILIACICNYKYEKRIDINKI